jgi:disulfide bond formation protein DsbB
MDITQFSTFLSILILGLLLATILLVVAFGFKKYRQVLLEQDYFIYIKMIGAIAFLATTGALIYQFVYALEICILCWWQRIFIFPIEIMALVGVWYKMRGTHMMILISSIFGLFFAAYHYYYHFQAFVLGRTVSLPCDLGGLLPACTESPILIFGFITIPFMAVVTLLSIFVLSAVAHVKFIKEGSKI